MQPPDKKIWFPAKRYGWGWGVPNCWQGWAVIALFYLLLACAGLLFLPRHPAVFVFSCVTLAILLAVVGYFRGEKPGWRWGKDDRKR